MSPTPSAARRELGAARYSTNLGARAAIAFRALLQDGIAGNGVGVLGRAIGGAGWQARPVETQELADPMVQAPWLAAGINLLARTTAPIALQVIDRPASDKNHQIIEDESHPVVRMLRHVDEDLDPHRARKHDAINMSLSGESVWILKDRLGEPVRTLTDDLDSLIDLPEAYRPISGHLVEAVRDRSNRIKLWRLASMGTRGGYREWPAGAVVNLFEIPDHRRPGRGLGMIQQAWGSAAQSHLAAQYNSTWLRNFGDPGGTLTVDGWLNDAEYRRLQTQVAETLDNPLRRGATQIIERGRYEQSRARPRDMAFETLIEAGRVDQSAVMGTSQGVLGGPDMTYATFRGHYQTFLFLRVVPYLDAIVETLNSSFFPRLRDITVSRHRVKYDRELLEKAIEDATEQAAQSYGLMRAGLSRNEAVSAAGLRTDPIPGYGDQTLLQRGLVPLAATVVAEGAAAVKALRDAGAKDEDVIRIAGDLGIQLSGLEEKPVPVPPKAPGAPAGDEEKKPTPKAKKAEKAAGSAVVHRAVPASIAEVDTGTGETPVEAEAPSRDELTEAWNVREARIVPRRRALMRRLSSVLTRARAAQLEAIRRFAEEGILPSKSASGPLLASRSAVASSHLAVFLRAWEDDAREEAAIRTAAPDRLVCLRCACDGSEIRGEVQHRPRQERFLQRHPRLRRLGLEPLRSAALAIRAQVSEEEIDRLIVVGTARFQEELALAISDESLRAFRRGVGAYATQLDIAVIDATAPEVLEFFRLHGLNIAEGTTSALGTTLRRNILQALSESTDIGALQARIEAGLAEVQAGVTRAFASHRHRAAAIAYTETGGADNHAAFESAKRAFEKGRITGIGWVTSGRGPAPTGTVRPSHFRLESRREVVTPGARFSNGLLYPLDRTVTGKAAEIVNCQCSIRFVKPKKKGEED